MNFPSSSLTASTLPIYPPPPSREFCLSQTIQLMEGARLEGRESWNSLQYLRQYPSENYGFKEFLERLRPPFFFASIPNWEFPSKFLLLSTLLLFSGNLNSFRALTIKGRWQRQRLAFTTADKPQETEKVSPNWKRWGNPRPQEVVTSRAAGSRPQASRDDG